LEYHSLNSCSDVFTWTQYLIEEIMTTWHGLPMLQIV
jgi:hypothetical protein